MFESNVLCDVWTMSEFKFTKVFLPTFWLVKK
jgi:hypothetical protein